MSEPTAEPVADNAEQAAPAGEAKELSFDEILADMDEDRRNLILERVNKPNREAKNLRDRVKALEPKAQEYDRLAEASQTEQERAQEALKAANSRTAALLQRAARAEVKSALAGVVDDPDAIVDDLNLARFVDDDGEIDSDAIKALRAKYAKFSGPRAPRPDTSQASAANGRSTPLTPQEEFAGFMKTALQQAQRR